MPMGNLLILFAGLAVYAGYGLFGFVYLLAMTVLSFLAGLWIQKKPWIFWICASANAGALLAVKVLPVTGLEFTAPLGISYFTLMILSYLADIRRGRIAPEENFLRWCLHVTYLPRLFFGPIQPYDPSVFQNRRLTWDGLSEGGVRVLWGLFLKLVIAARAGVIVSAISGDPAQYRGSCALAAMVLYSVQIFGDFAGGIHMVLGLSQMLGIRLKENFDMPYASQTPAEFWRRWHMTLGWWLREYVYIPLGGNRKGSVRKVFNTIATFLVSGLWHGVRYLLWGLLNGILVAFGDKFKTKWAPLNQFLTFLTVSLLWSFFIWPDTLTALTMIGSLFTDFQPGDLMMIGTLGLSLGDWAVLSFAMLLPRLLKNLSFRALAPAGRVAVICTIALLVLVFGRYGIGFDADAFIYSRF